MLAQMGQRQVAAVFLLEAGLLWCTGKECYLLAVALHCRLAWGSRAASPASQALAQFEEEVLEASGEISFGPAVQC